MFSCRICLICMVIILCISLRVGSFHAKKCAEIDKQALLNLKDGFIHGRHILSSWKSGDCCKWEGVSCNNLTGHVTGLELIFSDISYSSSPEVAGDVLDFEEVRHFFTSNISGALGGKIDSSICELHYLTFIDLSLNKLEGEIPKCIGSLGQLVELNLGENELVGYVPHTLTNLSNLQYLDLGFNYLIVNDLEWLSHLSNLRYLVLSYNNLSRAIDWPSSISKVPSLHQLSLLYCGLPQVNPKSILHMNSSTSLQILTLAANKFNSSILPWVLNVSKVLTFLDLSYNELEVSVVKSCETLCQLKDLKYLSLEHNPFSSGPLPDFSQLSSLTTLFLENTSIVGPLSFDHFPHLEFLDLSSNHLNGSIPEFEVSKFALLNILGLSHNHLSGTLPYAIGQLSNLTMLALSSNKLNGIISEAHLSNLSSLENLDVSRNSLHFKMNPNWVPPFQLQLLYASSCILGPRFPTWLKYQTNLEVLDISNTSIIDSFPQWLWDDRSSRLSHLNVSHNKLSGFLPTSLARIKLKDTTTWDFSFNNLSGPLPPFPKRLDNLFLSNNMLSGFVSSFCTMSPTSLTYLDLSSNVLAGQLPNCWQKFKSLQTLNLANNSFSGRMPKSFHSLRRIKAMHLNKNNFSGEIPSLTFSRSLKLIDFGNNILEGTLPTWVGDNLHHLIVLSLSNNRIQGSIPTSLCNLSFLQVLDLSTNNITGEIPQCLGHITALSNMKFPRQTIFYSTTAVYLSYDNGHSSFFDEMTLAWKGQNREYDKILGLMTIIDLSTNHLSGEIPQSVTTLMALTCLNLSGNNLTGLIPNNIGHIQMLESLDLSRNKLFGRMPPSFSNLSFLSYMNLSFNNLSGEIPLSTQLQSFDPSAYVGNIGLCGLPLTNQCPWDLIPPTERVDRNGSNKDEDELINFGFYISLGLGFCVGFWGVCGTLITKSSWRHAYFEFFNNIYDWIYVTVAVFVAKMKRRIQIQD